MITHTDIFISNDTGPMHLAALLQKRTIALFGPCSPAHYRFNKSIYVLYKHLYCSPCVHEFKIPPCKGNNICMKSISVNEVYQLCCEVLEGKNTAFDTSFQVKDIIYERQSDIAGFIER
ncbi:MAG: glycosyltransferase family 9 protein [Bacteroidales bacterium]|nr:glycosyltransferase family 9 protein [Bacteroidales bacterium]